MQDDYPAASMPIHAVAAPELVRNQSAQPRTPVPPDVRAFIDNADRCQHLAGEWDSDLSVARQQEIQRGVIKYCGLAQLQLKALSEKYKGDRATQALIAAHAHEPVLLFRK
jgi:hypothetical protein